MFLHDLYMLLVHKHLCNNYLLLTTLSKLLVLFLVFLSTLAVLLFGFVLALLGG